jgi:hypothetical protein
MILKSEKQFPGIQKQLSCQTKPKRGILKQLPPTAEDEPVQS